MVGMARMPPDGRHGRLYAVSLAPFREETMGKHFRDEQIEEFLKAYVARFPDTVERMEHVILNPFDDNDELMSQNSARFIRSHSRWNSSRHTLRMSRVRSIIWSGTSRDVYRMGLALWDREKSNIDAPPG